jgi:hypothetical protein
MESKIIVVQAKFSLDIACARFARYCEKLGAKWNAGLGWICADQATAHAIKETGKKIARATNDPRGVFAIVCLSMKKARKIAPELFDEFEVEGV